jgi:hypothetical protein
MADQNQIPLGPGVIDIVGGVQAFHALAGHLAESLSRLTEPEKVFLIGPQPDRFALVRHIRDDANEQVLSRIVSGPDVSHPDYGDIAFSLADSKHADVVIKTCKEADGPNVLVTLFQGQQEEYLEMVLDECPNLTVYALGGCDPDNPASVRFEKRVKAVVAASIPNIPGDAMYGQAYDFARALASPLGFSYPSVLATACGFGIEASGGIRPTLYVVPLGNVGTGKSVAKNRAGQQFFGSNPEDKDQTAIDERFVVKIPASDRGLYNILADANGKPRVLALDELRNMMGKGSIEGSTLMSLLCELWNANNAGVADKKGLVGVNCKLSLIGCLKVVNPAEFRDVFDYSSAHGFYDRCVFGIEPTNTWGWSHVPISQIVFNPSVPTISPDVYERVHAWKKESQGRGRLGEIVLRVAYITSAINRDSSVTEKALYAAIKFGEWQEQIRRYFQPAQGEDKSEQFVAEVERSFGALPGYEGNWRAMSRGNNWHKNFSRVIEPVKKMLVNQGVLIPCRKRGVFRLYK